MEKITTLHHLVIKKIKPSVNLHFTHIMEINLVINEFILYCTIYKVKEVDINILTLYWCKVFILTLKLYTNPLEFNPDCKLGENSYCFVKEKQLHAKFIFLNFLGDTIFMYSKYSIILWYKIGKILKVDVDKEIEKMIKNEQN